eukprot:COSAG02_NODE_42279_length_386_cov_0.536585_1_plen_51_part_10
MMSTVYHLDRFDDVIVQKGCRRLHLRWHVCECCRFSLLRDRTLGIDGRSSA